MCLHPTCKPRIARLYSMPRNAQNASQNASFTMCMHTTTRVSSPMTPFNPTHHSSFSTQPNIPKQQYQCREERKPGLPPDPRALRHPQHPVHRPLDPRPAILKLIVHLLRQRSRVTDLVTDEMRQLCKRVSSNQGLQVGVREPPTSFNILTFPINTPVCSSF